MRDGWVWRVVMSGRGMMGGKSRGSAAVTSSVKWTVSHMFADV